MSADASMIVVMGPTGSGKSTFINLASGSNIPVGNGLRSCTAKVTPTAPFFIDGREVILLDTPGFDDTTTPDFDTLEEIAQYMASIYKTKRLLDGILYFHSIADRRMGGIQERNLRIFESLCGDDPLKSVVVVTNMWGLVPSEELGIAREKELVADPVYFGHVLNGGAKLMRHNDTKQSSHAIISSLIDRADKTRKLTIQTEMVDEKLRVDETCAAAELIQDFDGIIRNLQRRVEKERHVKPGETPQERKARRKSVEKMRARIRQLEERKEGIAKRRGSLWLHAAFLRWITSRFP